MAVTLSAAMAARTITATITGMSEEYVHGRTFEWYLDGALIRTEKVTAQITTREYAYTRVGYKESHTVLVYIRDLDETELFYTLTVNVTDSLKLWDWNASNGTATAAQTKAAYASASSEGLTMDFSRLVWNDLVNSVYGAELLSGRSWTPSYESYLETLMQEAGDPLTAARFNRLVNNLWFPWPYWAHTPGRKGYLGRLSVYGREARGDNADVVYGDYLLEIAHILNAQIDAIGDFGAGYITKLSHTAAHTITASGSAVLRRPEAKHMAYSVNLAALIQQYLALRASEAKHLTHSVTAELSAELSAQLSKPISQHFRHVVYAGLVLDESLVLLSPQSDRFRHVVAAVLRPTADLLFRAPGAKRLEHSLTASLGDEMDATLRALETRKMEYAVANAISAILNTNLRTPGARRMLHTVTVGISSILNAALSTPSSKPLTMDRAESLTISESCVLSASPSFPLVVAAQIVLDDVHSFSLTTPASAAAAIARTVLLSAALSAELWASPSALFGCVLAEQGPSGAAQLSAADSKACALAETASTVCYAALIAQPVIEPSSDWAVQVGTNLDIRRTYYNHLDADDSTLLLLDQAWFAMPVQVGTNLDIRQTYYNRLDVDDSTLLLIDQAWYAEPVQVGTNLNITSIGVNDYGLEDE